MYLSRMQLDRTNRVARIEAHDCVAMHRRVMQGITLVGSAPRAASGTLYRLDHDRDRDALSLLVQSAVEPRWDRLPDGYVLPGTVAVKALGGSYAAIRTGMVLTFRLRANPTRKVDTKSRDGVKRNGRRVAVSGGEAGSLEWLSRKGAAAGFELLDGSATLEGTQTGGARGIEASPLSFASVLFAGHLRVTSADALRAGLQGGIGTGRAYGFGLLSVAPATGYGW